MTKYGLIGRHISYSFSRGYFREKFQREGIAATYENFDLPHISELPAVIKDPAIKGLNVTIPYKEAVIPFLDQLDPVAAKIGAVNTILVDSKKRLIGYNTDHYGFSRSISPFLQPGHNKALILGTGGASKAVAFALRSLGIEPRFVSRSPGKDAISYTALNEVSLATWPVIINCTPLGTSPDTEAYPPIPTEHLTSLNLVFDLIYNPPITRLMTLAKEQGATVVNGADMLTFQAEKAWEIWNP